MNGGDVQPRERVSTPGPAWRDFSLARSALWLMVAKTAAFALSLAVPLLLVRQLSVREFGVYKQLLLLVDTAMVILPLGFAFSAFYFFPREPTRRPHVVANIALIYVIMAGLGGGLVMVFPGQISTLLNSRDLVAYAPAVGMVILLLVGTSFVEYVAIANGEARIAALLITATQLLRSGLVVAAGVLFGSVRAVVGAAMAHGFLQSIGVVWYMRSRFSGVGWQVEWRLMRAQLAYTMPLAYSSLLWWLQGYGHNYFVSNRFGAAAFAVYSVGCSQLPIVGIMLDSVGSVVIRAVSDLRSRNETREIVRLAARTVRMLAAVMLPFYALMLVTGREVITILFTRQYLASWPIFAVYLTLIPATIIAPVYNAVFRAYPEYLPFFIGVRTALMVPLLGGLWIFTGRLGLVGAAALVVAVTLADRAVMAVRVAGILGMSRNDLGLFRDVAKLGVAAGAAGLATEITRRVVLGNGLDAPLGMLVVSTGVFVFVYLAAVLLLRVLTPEEREVIRQWVARVHQIALRRNAVEAPKPGACEPSV